MGCSSLVRQQLKSEKLYRNDLVLKKITAKDVSGKKLWEKKNIKGVVVLPRAFHYEIKVKSKGELDLLIWETCSQQHSVEARDDDATINFSLNPLERACDETLKIKGVEEKRGRDSFATIAFASPKYKNKEPWVLCNGKYERSEQGTSICQSKKGLRQYIEFKETAFLAPREEACLKPEGWEGKKLVFDMVDRNCVRNFGDLKGQKHRLILMPYDDIIINRERD